MLAQPGALDGAADHPTLGAVPRSQLLAIATNDLLVHAWDLSRAVGLDETLPPALDTFAAAQDQLLALAGRQP